MPQGNHSLSWRDIDRCELVRRRASEGLTGKHERCSKARLSGFGLIVELAAGGRSAEARKSIALGPGDRNAKSGPFAIRVEQPLNRKVRAISSENVRSDRGEATGGRQQCRPPFSSWPAWIQPMPGCKSRATALRCSRAGSTLRSNARISRFSPRPGLNPDQPRQAAASASFARSQSSAICAFSASRSSNFASGRRYSISATSIVWLYRSPSKSKK